MGGESIDSISKDTSIPKSSIYYWINRYGEDMRKKTPASIVLELDHARIRIKKLEGIMGLRRITLQMMIVLNKKPCPNLFFGQGSSKSLLVVLSECDTNNYKIALEYKHGLSYESKKSVSQEPSSISQSRIASNLPYDPQTKIINKLTQKQTMLTNEEIAKIVEDYKNGLNTNELAKKYSCHKVTISKKLKASGVKIRYQSPNEYQINKMIQLYESGLSLEKVGKQLNFSARSVLRYLQMRGVKMRVRRGGRRIGRLQGR